MLKLMAKKICTIFTLKNFVYLNLCIKQYKWVRTICDNQCDNVFLRFIPFGKNPTSVHQVSDVLLMLQYCILPGTDQYYRHVVTPY